MKERVEGQNFIATKPVVKNGVTKMILLLWIETLIPNKKEEHIPTNGKHFNIKVVSVKHVVKIDQQLYVSIIEIHLKKN